MRGIFNIIIGGIMVVGGLSGVLVLKGTQSGGALAAIGGFLVILGFVRLLRSAE